MLIPTVFAQAPDVGPSGICTLQTLILRVIGLAAGAAFFALTIMLVYAGIRFITSSGDPKNLAAARQVAIQAVVGIFFLAGAWLVLKLISVFTGTDVTLFSLGFPGVPTCT